jgi:ribose transport system permease protein
MLGDDTVSTPAEWPAKRLQGWSTKTLATIFQLRMASVTAVFLVLCLFFWAQKPDVFLKPANLAVMMRFVATFGLLAIGEILVIITGGIDLSVGSMTALTGVLVALLMMRGIAFIPPVGAVPAMAITLACAALVGIWHGFCVTKLHIPAFIVTLGTWLIVRGLAAFITRGYPILFPPESPFLILGQGEIYKIPVMFIILLLVALIASFLLEGTTLGRHIYAIGGNIEAARVSSINVDGVRVFCYAISGLMAGAVGILLASRLGQGTPTVGEGYELWAIAATVIGGASLMGGEGSVVGAILGAATMGVMVNGLVLINTSSYLQNVVLGAVLMMAVAYDMWRRHRHD